MRRIFIGRLLSADGSPVRPVFVVILLSIVGCDARSERPLANAQRLLDQGENEKAEKVIATIAPSDADWPRGQLALAELAMARRDYALASRHYSAVPRDGRAASLEAISGSAELALKEGDLSRAVAELRELRRLQPSNVRAGTQLLKILRQCGFRDEADAIAIELLRANALEFQELVSLTNPDRYPDPSPTFRQAMERHPQDPFLLLAQAGADVAGQRLAQAEPTLRAILAAHPDFEPAQAMLGEILVDRDPAEFSQWHSSLPESLTGASQIAYVRGLLASRLHEPRVAAKCFWEAVRKSPVNRRAWYHLAASLMTIDPMRAEPFSKRAGELKDLSDALEQLLITGRAKPENFILVVSGLCRLGRGLEAKAWQLAVRQQSLRIEWPEDLAGTLAKVDQATTPRIESNALPEIDLSDYPDFETLLPRLSPKTPRSKSPAGARIAFTDEAAATGMDFTYFHSPRVHHGVRIFETTGGGIGVADYDRDGICDLYFTQGVEWPKGVDQSASTGRYVDVLYRGRGRSFAISTQSAALTGDVGYGQGCSFGDIDNDGFSDLYVANIGCNVLHLNNGDGTFTDVTIPAGVAGNAWTTSCLILDLNGDGNPDLYDVTYLEGNGIFRTECGEHRCSVRNYSGAPDRVLCSNGEGAFTIVNDATPAQNGKGLGIVPMYLDDERLPSLFIANDQIPDFFLRPRDSQCRFDDVAPRCGLAVNRDGMPTASMGTASGELNGDHRTDLFVTNFSGESNTLFLQREGGVFEDVIPGTGLMAAGIPYVGWGAQFIDADNDGDLDLAVANGHIGDFGEQGAEYRMPTQFFQNDGSLQFHELTGAEAGELFTDRIYGRSLATLDWNRDGRTDFVISAIASPAILATSAGDPSGHYVDVELHASLSARDGDGAIVEVRAGDRSFWQQAGTTGGYQVSNERRLHFGLGGDANIDSIRILWPSGAVSVIEPVGVDRLIIVSEGIQAWTGQTMEDN